MQICLKNNFAKCYPNPIWNDGALGFFEDGLSNKKNKQDEQQYGISSWSKNCRDNISQQLSLLCCIEVLVKATDVRLLKLITAQNDKFSNRIGKLKYWDSSAH